MNKPDKLILDYSTWRCGGDGPNKLGTGIVALLNGDGCMCCLGQWSRQLDVTDDELMDKGEPSELDTLIPLFVEDGKRNTGLAIEAIGINDDSETTPEYKIIELTRLLATEGILLEVINKPE